MGAETAGFSGRNGKAWRGSQIRSVRQRLTLEGTQNRGNDVVKGSKRYQNSRKNSARFRPHLILLPPPSSAHPQVAMSDFINAMLVEEDVAYVDEDRQRVMCRVCKVYVNLGRPSYPTPAHSQPGDERRRWRLDWNMHRQNHFTTQLSL